MLADLMVTGTAVSSGTAPITGAMLETIDILNCRLRKSAVHERGRSCRGVVVASS